MLKIDIRQNGTLTEKDKKTILHVCNSAFGQPFNELFDFLSEDAIHVMGYDAPSRELLSHAVITERCFWIGDGPGLKTAYVDAVATLPEAQRKGYAGQVMHAVIRAAAPHFQLAGLSTFIDPWYKKLGWVPWRGTLALRQDDAVIATPEEKATVMVHRLPKTPDLDFNAPLIATWRPGGGW